MPARAKGYKNTFFLGGHVEFSESAKDAVIREIEEEIPFHPIILDDRVFFSLSYPLQKLVYSQSLKYLSEQSWKELLSTYAEGNYDGVWKAMFAMGSLFRSTAKYVADHFQYVYPYEDDLHVMAYLEQVQKLSPDATDIY